MVAAGDWSPAARTTSGPACHHAGAHYVTSPFHVPVRARPAKAAGGSLLSPPAGAQPGWSPPTRGPPDPAHSAVSAALPPPPAVSRAPEPTFAAERKCLCIPLLVHSCCSGAPSRICSVHRGRGTVKEGRDRTKPPTNPGVAESPPTCRPVFFLAEGPRCKTGPDTDPCFLARSPPALRCCYRPRPLFVPACHPELQGRTGPPATLRPSTSGTQRRIRPCSPSQLSPRLSRSHPMKVLTHVNVVEIPCAGFFPPWTPGAAAVSRCLVNLHSSLENSYFLPPLSYSASLVPSELCRWPEPQPRAVAPSARHFMWAPTRRR